MKKEQGVSLIESLLVIAMVGIIVVLLANLPNAFSLINKSKHTSLAREIATKQIEDKRAINFANLANGNSQISDFRMSLLSNSSGMVLVEDCDVLICSNGEPIKKITVTINWQDNAREQTISLQTFIGEGGINQ